MAAVHATRGTKPAHRTASLKGLRNAECRSRLFSESLPCGHPLHPQALVQPTPIAESIQRTADRSSSEVETRSKGNAQPGSHSCSTSQATPASRTGGHVRPACHCWSIASYAPEPRKSVYLRVPVTPSTFSNSPNPARNAPGLQKQQSD